MDLISLISAVVPPSDPFCLVEVFQPPQNDEKDALSCVLVMKGDRAFSCRAGMFLPGDKVVINSVQCQR